MVRWIGVILLHGCLVTQMHAQAPKKLASAGQTTAAERGPAEPAGARPAKSQYPLDAFTDFSAVMVGSVMELGEGDSEAHIYRSGKLMRMEGPEGHGYFVTNLTTLETYGMSAGPCMHDSHPFFRAAPFAAARRPGCHSMPRLPCLCNAPDAFPALGSLDSRGPLDGEVYARIAHVPWQ